jgi:cell division protein FtsL
MSSLSPRSAAVATSLLALVALVCVVLGAGRILGPVLLATDRDFTFEPRDQDYVGSPAPTETQEYREMPIDEGSGAFGTVMLLLLIALAVAALVLALWILWRAHRLRAERRPEAAEDDDEDDELLEVEHAQRALAGAQQSLEYAPTPRDAIIESWLALEQGIAAAGIARRPAQTTTEYVVSVLSDIDLPDADLRVLADLYGRALFDDEEIPEDARSRAREALTRLSGLLPQEAGR